MNTTDKEIILIDFWAEWCAPCRTLLPIINEIAVTYADKITVKKINIDEDEETTATYNIRSVPTLVLLKNNEIQDIKKGVLTKSQLTAWLDGFLS
jgi:thioredoxin 1